MPAKKAGEKFIKRTGLNTKTTGRFFLMNKKGE
jgi:hypothetical protein